MKEIFLTALFVDGMKDADCVVGTVVDNKVQVIDCYLQDSGSAMYDTDLPGGTNDILAYIGTYSNNIMTFKFLRNLQKTDAYDTTFSNSRTLISMAIGISMGFGDHVETAKGIQINFLNPIDSNIPTEYTLFRFHLIVTAAVILLNCLIGIFVTYVQIMHTTWLGNLLFHRKLFAKLPNMPKNICVRLLFWFLDPIFQVMMLTPASAWIILNYFVLCGVWFAYGVANAYTSGYTELNPWARGFGNLIILNLSFVILPVARYSVWYYIFGIPFDRAVKFHKWLGYFNFAIISIHGLLMIIQYQANAFTWNVATINGDKNYWNLAGFIGWICFLFMMLFSFSKVRQLSFEFFYLTHYIFGIPAIVFSILHCKLIDLLPYIGASLILYFLDLLLRFALGYLWPTTLISIHYNEQAKVTKLILEKFKEVFPIHPGQYIYLWIHRVLPLENHAFTIASVEESLNKWMTRFTLFIKNEGNYTWTGLLAKVAQRVELKKTNLKHIFVRVEGPYGTLAAYPFNFNTIVLASGGIGVTPMMMMAHSLSKQIEQNKTKKLKKIVFVWSVRERAMLEMILPELPKSSVIEYRIHLTGEQANTANAPELHPQSNPGTVEQIANQTSTVVEKTDSKNIVATLVNIEGIPIYHGRADLNSVLKEVR